MNVWLGSFRYQHWTNVSLPREVREPGGAGAASLHSGPTFPRESRSPAEYLSHRRSTPSPSEVPPTHIHGSNRQHMSHAPGVMDMATCLSPLAAPKSWLIRS